MASGCDIKGINNKVQILENGKIREYTPIKGLNIAINGNNNSVLIELPSNFIQTHIIMDGDNNSFKLKATRHRFIRHTTFGLIEASSISLGGGISVYKNLHCVAKAGKSIDIGDECMFATDIIIRNDDGHVILDKTTREVLNKSDDIKLGNHVWVGTRSMILKGSDIKDGSIIGAMSLVNKKFDENDVIIAGVPAKVVKKNVEWLRMNYNAYMQKHVNTSIEPELVCVDDIE